MLVSTTPDWMASSCPRWRREVTGEFAWSLVESEINPKCIQNARDRWTSGSSACLFPTFSLAHSLCSNGNEAAQTDRELHVDCATEMDLAAQGSPWTMLIT